MKVNWLEHVVLAVGLVLFLYGGVGGAGDHRNLIIAPFVPWAFWTSLVLIAATVFNWWRRNEASKVAQGNRQGTFRMWLSTFPRGGRRQ